jgi:uncharacterized protein
MKVVIDTNVLVSRAISEKRAPAAIFRLIGEGAFEHLVSQAILDEYRSALEYEHVRKLHRRTGAQIITLLSEIEEAATVILPSISLLVIEADPDDNKVLECAVAGGADYIVSGDKHLLSLGEYAGIRILSPAEFLRVLEQTQT